MVTRRPAQHVSHGVPASISTSDLDEALRPEVDLVIECLGGVEPAGSVIQAALAMGKTVVSANKATLAAYGRELAVYMREPDRRLWFGAAVGCAGQGSGRWPTTLAVLGDVREIVRRRSCASPQ